MSQTQAPCPPKACPDPIRLAVTCGEPAGIGAEVALKALSGSLPNGLDVLLVGPRLVWKTAAQVCGREAVLDRHQVLEPSAVTVQDWDWGQPSVQSGRIAAEAVERAADLALADEVAALVTAPLTKEGLFAAGRPFPGHTELLQHHCGEGARATMMLAGSRLRVVLVTTHRALREVAGAVTEARVLETIRAAHRGLVEDLGISRPRIAVTALNPHTGEGGVLGTEEATDIDPAIARAREEGIDASGPHAADSLFHRAVDGGVDAVVAMYHDQGLIPLKLIHFHDGVNVTLGLPIVRTSPDHGTAFDCAGKGVAREDSFREAVRWAADIAVRRKTQPARVGA